MSPPAATAVPTPTQPARHRATIGAAITTVFLASGAVLAATGTSRIRYSADHHRTIGIWEIWIPVAVCLLATRLTPPQLPTHPPEPRADEPRREALTAVAIAVAFALAVIAFVDWYVPIKIALLAVAPALILGNRTWFAGSPRRAAYRAWWWIGPAVVTAVWLAITWLGPWARSTSGTASVAALVGALVLNVYLEERFYRGALQTRLEHVLGRWTAIGATALLWAIWHLAIHSTQRPLVDAATVIAHHGTLGLMLGYLWARYRNPWPLLAIHAGINTPLDLLGGISLAP
jgi:membrane protease YdiL (CAAX protease family)